MQQSGNAGNRRVTRREAISAGVGLAGAAAVGGVAAQEPVASPGASPVASPVGTPAATPEPDVPLDIIAADALPDDGDPVAGGTLRLPVARASLTDLALPSQRQDPQVAWSYLDALVRIDPDIGTPVPSLAESWAWSDDGLTLTFSLREDVAWHDGTPFAAADVRFTLIAYRDDYRSVVAGQTALVDDVVVVDDAAVEVQFSEPDGAWLFNVASLPIIPAHQYRERWESNLVGERTLDGIRLGDELPVGTGPWVIEAFSPDGLSFARNADYFDTPPHAARLELVPASSPGERLRLWEAGEVHVLGDLDPQRVQDMLEYEGRLVVADSPRALFAAFNLNNPTRHDPVLLADLRVREALSLALDRERYAEEAWGGFLRHEPAGLILQPWVDADTERNPAQNREQARMLLQQAGWADYTGDGIHDSPYGDALVLTAIVQDTVEPAVLATLEAMDADLRQVGGALAIEVLPSEAFVNRWSEERTWELVVYDLKLYPAFAAFDLVGSAWDVSVNPTGWNPGGYWNPVVDEALAAYFAAVEVDAMSGALQTLHQALIDDPFALWLGQPQTLTLLRPEVRGFVPNPLWPTLDTRLMWLSEQ